MLASLVDAGLETALDAAVLELLGAAGCSTPPVDALFLARQHFQLTVCQDRRLLTRGRAQQVLGGGHIYVRPEPRPERLHWTIAHEIAEHLGPRLWQACGLAVADVSPTLAEALANAFAQRLLAPTAWLQRAVQECGWDLLALKQRFYTASHEVFALRLLELPGSSGLITILDHGQVTRRRGRPWPAPRWLLPGELRCQLWIHERSQPCQVQVEGYDVWGWPVHESGWKREILRTVFNNS